MCRRRSQRIINACHEALPVTSAVKCNALARDRAVAAFRNIWIFSSLGDFKFCFVQSTAKRVGVAGKVSGFLNGKISSGVAWGTNRSSWSAGTREERSYIDFGGPRGIRSKSTQRSPLPFTKANESILTLRGCLKVSQRRRATSTTLYASSIVSSFAMVRCGM